MRETTTHGKNAKQWLLLIFSWLTFLSPSLLRGAARQDETSFLDVPLGGRPTAMGGAYSALANDAYASNLNPGGLGFLKSTQFTGQHISYFGSGHFDHVGFGARLSADKACGPSEFCPGSSLGGSVQYLSGGQYTGTDIDGNASGDFSTQYAVYNLSFGRAFTRRLSLGLTGKWINARLADVSANAAAADVGTMYRVNKNLTFATVLTNLGPKMTFLKEAIPLPTALHVGLAYQREDRWTLSAEGVRHFRAPAGARLGLEVNPIPKTALRLSYRTDAEDSAEPLAGFAAGFGVQHNGMDFAYAWKPLSNLGVTHHFSFGYTFDGHSKENGGR